MTAMMRVPRTRGAGSGVLLILLGAWGALIPFIGPYFHFAYTPDTAWAWTWGRFFLEIVPGVATALGGLILLISAFRPVAMFGAALAAAGGAWFAVGSMLGPVWASSATLGVPRWCPGRARPRPGDRGPAAHGGRAPELLHRIGRGHRVPRRRGVRPPVGGGRTGRPARGRRRDLVQAQPPRRLRQARVGEHRVSARHETA